MAKRFVCMFYGKGHSDEGKLRVRLCLATQVLGKEMRGSAVTFYHRTAVSEHEGV